MGKRVIMEVIFGAENAWQGVDTTIKFKNLHLELTVCASYHGVTLACTPAILFILRCKMCTEVFVLRVHTLHFQAHTVHVHVQNGLYDIYSSFAKGKLFYSISRT